MENHRLLGEGVDVGGQPSARARQPGAIPAQGVHADQQDVQLSSSILEIVAGLLHGVVAEGLLHAPLEAAELLTGGAPHEQPGDDHHVDQHQDGDQNLDVLQGVFPVEGMTISASSGAAITRR